MSVISAKEFKEKATRVIQIDGFEAGEKIEVRIKPASILNLMISGKLPNSLLNVVQEVFGDVDEINNKLQNDSETMKAAMQLMDLVCEQCLVEPKYSEIAEFLTDNQKSQIMIEAQGNVTAATPSI